MDKVAILLAEGFEEIEAVAVLDILRRGEIVCDLVSIDGKCEVKGAHDLIVKVDNTINCDMDQYKMVVCPGGVLGADNLSKSQKVLSVIDKFLNNSNKYVAAICASPAVVLSKSDFIKNKKITSYPGEEYKKMLSNSIYKDEIVVVDDNLITSRGPATTMEFAYTLVDILKGDSSKLKKGMLYNMIKE